MVRCRSRIVPLVVGPVNLSLELCTTVKEVLPVPSAKPVCLVESFSVSKIDWSGMVPLL
jgi:hypothetical protein